MIRSLIILFAVFVGLLLPASPAQAQVCTATVDPLSFGVVALTGGEVRSATAMRISCTGIPRRQVRVCASLGEGSGGSQSGDPRYMLFGASRVAYQLYRTNGNAVFGSWTWPHAAKGDQIMVSLGNNGQGSETIPIRGEIPAGQIGLPAGTYLSAFQGPDARITYGYNNATGGCSTAGGASAFASFTVSVVNQATCTVAATPLDFGTVGLMSGALSASATLSVTCPPGLPYTIGLDGGLAQASNPVARQMRGPTGTVAYALYRNSARTLPWGNLAGQTLGGTGSGAVQSVPVYGAVPQQDLPGPGEYTDTVVVTVTY
jgi:spore coat protein U-like protein